MVSLQCGLLCVSLNTVVRQVSRHSLGASKTVDLSGVLTKAIQYILCMTNALLIFKGIVCKFNLFILG